MKQTLALKKPFHPHKMVWIGLFLFLSIPVVGCAFFVILLFGNPFDRNPFDDFVFDQSRWLADRPCLDEGSRCAGMSTDILKRLQPGVTEKTVIALLGKPEPFDRKQTQKAPDRFTPEEQRANKVFAYFLGKRLNELYGIDRAWLHLRFDEQGHYLGGRVFRPNLAQYSYPKPPVGENRAAGNRN
nr:hypothetical protein [uncultured bacterium]